MVKAHKIDATQGPILKNLILFAIPLAVGAFVQRLFSSADMMVIGNFAGTNAVASIGATGVVTGLILSFAVAITAGTNLVLAQAMGQKDRAATKRGVDVSVILALFFGLVIATAGFFLSKPLLLLTNCPAECLTDAILYMRIYFFSSIPSLLYMFTSSVIIISGDTTRPFIYSIVMGALNVVLNVILCFILPNKVAAVAIATLISQSVGAFLATRYLILSDEDYKLKITEIKFNGATLVKVLAVGLPCAFNGIIGNLTEMVVQTQLNSFGASAIAGNSAAANIQGWSAAFLGAIGSATITFMGQNIGAKNRARIKSTIFTSIFLSCSITLFFSISLFLLGRPLLSLYLPDDAFAVEIGILRMKYMLLTYAIPTLAYVISQSLQAFEYTLVSLINSIISVTVFRVIWIKFIFPLAPSMSNIYTCFLASNVLNLIIFIVAFIIVYKKKMNIKNFPQSDVALN